MCCGEVMGRFEKRKGKQEMARARELGIDLDDEEYDESTEDEDDYESQIEKNERKTDENVKRKVMNALQSALSDLQLTGIQIKWSDIEVDRRIGVGGFAIVYHGLYRCV